MVVVAWVLFFLFGSNKVENLTNNSNKNLVF